MREVRMIQEGLHLNLARKWRSRQFDEVVGQELPVRILQNSLYLNQFFPVYLMSGQRGCGKTTMARLFAGAVNCENLELFQKSPKTHKVPCLACVSCIAMAKGSHPDFIEIDAASHTGVDNVRSIIESASLLPVLGRKKIYLIDEAHMLSKAAFNAFLKILEEPPASVLFILATTDPHKIIETVKSRCFQLFFTSIATQPMVKHLTAICEKETIPYDQAALRIIATETEGSARDALNLLEQVRFSHAKVTIEAVGLVLGHMPEALLLDVFEAISYADVPKLMELIAHSSFDQYTPMAVWKKSTELVRTMMFCKQRLDKQDLFEDVERIASLADQLSIAQIVEGLRHLYVYESLLLKTMVSRDMLEMLFIELCQKMGRAPLLEPSLPSVQPILRTTAAKKMLNKEISQESFSPVEGVLPSEIPSTEKSMASFSDVALITDERWEKFIAGTQTFSDPLLQSIFKQAQFKEYDAVSAQVIVIFAREATFFASWIQDTKAMWESVLREHFGAEATLKLSFEGSKIETLPVKKQDMVGQKEALSTGPEKAPVVQKTAGFGTYKNTQSRVEKQGSSIKKELLVDISDTQKWQKAQMLKEAFGGSIVEVPGDEIYDETEL